MKNCYLVLYSLMLAVTQCSEFGLGILDKSKQLRQEVCRVFDPYAWVSALFLHSRRHERRQIDCHPDNHHDMTRKITIINGKYQ